MVTKKRAPEMTPLQMINRAIREDESSAVIRKHCDTLVGNMLRLDATVKPVLPMNAEFVMALHAVIARLQSVERENETLKRKLRRDNRRTSSKPKPELLKKEPEQSAQAT